MFDMWLNRTVDYVFNDEVDCNYVAVFKLTRKLYGFSALFNFGGKRSDKNLNSYVFSYYLPTD